ncbi:hypothetical protein ACH5RR_013409 [Cinchona calisaya]|uniref:Fungal-type protein kinase domain-containing protein n=1 Tax=Cinchona calisaya TaxID=153742 RepID=A0ABD3A2L4_9GENT
MQGIDTTQYHRLWDYATTVREGHPESKVKLMIDRPNENERETFLRMYYYLYALKQGFLDGCRPIIGLDGCFLKSAFGDGDQFEMDSGSYGTFVVDLENTRGAFLGGKTQNAAEGINESKVLSGSQSASSQNSQQQPSGVESTTAARRNPKTTAPRRNPPSSWTKKTPQQQTSLALDILYWYRKSFVLPPPPRELDEDMGYLRSVICNSRSGRVEA